MRVFCFLLLAARANSQPQESETVTFSSPLDEAVAIDNAVLEALEQELIRNNIALTRGEEIPEDIAKVADLYDRVQNPLSHPDAELPSLRKGILKKKNGSPQKDAVVAFGVGSIVSLAKVALVMIALNSGLREAFVSVTGAASGTLKFQQAAAPFGPTVITGTLTGLSSGEHGFHIHEFGKIMDGCATTGAHYNPFNVAHGGPTNSTLARHVGDLGNIVASSSGTAVVHITDSQVTLVGPTSVIGRAVVVHQSKDDLGLGGTSDSLITGNAGARVGCGVIARA